MVRPLASLVLALWAWAVLFGPAHAIEAYIFRGAGDFSFIAKRLTFSEGMDTLGDKLTAAGIRASVYRWEAGELAYREITRRRPESVALIGHSMGALTALAIAGRLKSSGIRVAYLGVIDIPGPVGATPANVEVAQNYYHAFPVFGQLTAGPGHRGTIMNRFVWGQVHITMDNAKLVHNGMLAAISSARGEGEVMQAYAPDANQTVIGEVDRVLTASTTSNSEAPGARPRAGLPERVDTHETVALESMAAMALPDSVPVPTPRPAVYSTRTGLPPIE